jgi:hypothetical protein
VPGGGVGEHTPEQARNPAYPLAGSFNLWIDAGHLIHPGRKLFADRIPTDGFASLVCRHPLTSKSSFDKAYLTLP